MKKTALLASITFILLACNPIDIDGPSTVENVDLSRYTGKWYEIASIPQFFSLGCNNTTAEYTAQENGIIKVENKCRLGSPNGPLNYISGKAKSVDASNSKLNVTFVNTFGPGSNYWIIELAPDYSYSVVSDPNKSTLFLLSRTPSMPDAQVQDIFERLDMMGFDVSKIKMTPQG